MTKIQIPASTIEKIASFLESVPSVVSSLSAPAKPETRKHAAACAQELVKHAGLDPNRCEEFAAFIQTDEGAIKTIGSLTNKIASLQAELNSARNLTVGGPGALPSRKTASAGEKQSSTAWCEALLG